jgi:hypothetical protein
MKLILATLVAIAASFLDQKKLKRLSNIFQPVEILFVTMMRMFIRDLELTGQAQ